MENILIEKKQEIKVKDVVSFDYIIKNGKSIFVQGECINVNAAMFTILTKDNKKMGYITVFRQFFVSDINVKISNLKYLLENKKHSRNQTQLFERKKL